MARRATLVLSGGGARGAFQVGAEQVLRTEGGFEWEQVFGVSVGALNGALIAQHAYDRLEEIWQSITEKEIYRKVGRFKVAWRLAMQHKTGLYDSSPLRATIEKYLGGNPFLIPLHVGRVSMVSGLYETVSSPDPEMLDAIWQSTTMPVIWEPIGPQAFVDGGLRNVTPLSDTLRYDCTELVVIPCSLETIEPAPRPADILATVKRALADIMINEIFHGDLRGFTRINRLVTQAAAAGLTLRHTNGTPYRYCPLTLILPNDPLGDTLDFSRAAIAKRLSAGQEAARACLAESGSARR